MTLRADSASPLEPFALRAKFIFPVDGPPIRDGVLSIAGDRILAVGANHSGREPRDLGAAAILPGLVNAHTHLEFSHLPAPLGTPRMAFVEWLRAVLFSRTVEIDPKVSIRQGLAESLAGGVTTLGEIDTGGWTPAAFAAPPIDVTLFRELIGLSPTRIGNALATAEAHLGVWPNGGGVHAALSPHAPYTAAPELVQAAVELARKYGRPLAMHLAETREELELLAVGRGPFVDLLQERGVWRPDLFRDRSVGGLLEILSAAPRALVIHGNYLAPKDWATLADQRDAMTAVYCPRTHAFFGHEPYPLAEMLAAGVALAVGTDSRASSPDLNLFEELRFIAAHHPSVAPATVLQLGTLAGAKALGHDARIGSLTAGKMADFCVLPIGDSAATDPYSLLWESAGGTIETWRHGRLVYPSDRGGDAL